MFQQRLGKMILLGSMWLLQRCSDTAGGNQKRVEIGLPAQQAFQTGMRSIHMFAHPTIINSTLVEKRKIHPSTVWLGGLVGTQPKQINKSWESNA